VELPVDPRPTVPVCDTRTSQQAAKFPVELSPTGPSASDSAAIVDNHQNLQELLLQHFYNSEMMSSFVIPNANAVSSSKTHPHYRTLPSDSLSQLNPDSDSDFDSEDYSEDNLPIQCTNCGIDESYPDIEVKKCSRCKTVQYCSRSCQEEHWKCGHKSRCSMFWQKDWTFTL